MNSFVLGAQLLLAAVFATAGVAKLLDRSGSRQALADFGVPQRVLTTSAVLLPLAELGIAAALVAHPTAGWGAVAALALLLAFVIGIARALARGEAPDCHCFGQLHSAPAGRATLARNGALAAIAATVAIEGGGAPLDDWVSARTAAELAAVGTGIAAAALGAFCLRLWLDRRELRRDLERERATVALFPPGLPVGASAPAFALPDMRGETLTLAALLERRRPIALVFVSPGCGPCASLFPELARWEAPLSEQLTIALVSSGGVEENRRVSGRLGVNLLLQNDSEVMDAFRVRATPSAVIVSPEGRIASAVAEGGFAVEPLIRLALRNGPGAVVGEPHRANGARSEQPQASA